MYCCGDEKDDSLICCEARSTCTMGEVFHYACVGLDSENIPDPWYCSDKCKNKDTLYRYCHCHENMGDDVPMIGCAAEDDCSGYEWYHYECVGLSPETLPIGDWFCGSACAKKRKKTKGQRSTAPPPDSTDYVYTYSRAITWSGLNLICRRDAVREADGEAMMSHWKLDLVHFFARKHPKYVILAHRLIASLNGWVSAKLRQELTWNRTVNYGGGMGRNLPMDLMNEILNRLFKDLLGASKGRYTDNTVQRCSQIVGPLGESLDAVFDSNVIENELYRHRRREHNRDGNVATLVSFIGPDDIFSIKCGRKHTAFPNFQHTERSSNAGKFVGKMRQLSKVLDMRREAVTNRTSS